MLKCNGGDMMKYLLFLLFLLVLITGCSVEKALPSEAEPTATTAVPIPSSPETVPPTTSAPDPIELLLESMSMEEQVGQLFLARCNAPSAAADTASYHLGGFVLFGNDFQDQTPASMAETIASYQNAAKIPLLIAVDEEGGTVTRVSRYPQYRSSPYPSPRNLYNQGGIDLIKSTETEKCQLLASLGVNVNLGPVCDISDLPGAILYYRSLGQSAEITSDFIVQTVSVMADNHIGSVLKHFPGYGNNADTHVQIATDSRTLEALESCDLIPFQAGIDAGADAVMVSHTIAEALDGDLPASLSPAVHQYLRQNMGFDGVILTDDLVMQAITEQYGTGEAAVLAVLAGNDLLCCTEYAQQYQAVLDAVLSGRIDYAQLRSSVLRILRWKQELGLI